jgi:hypothetical protein
MVEAYDQRNHMTLDAGEGGVAIIGDGTAVSNKIIPIVIQ